ncbi:MAG: SusC/RagA family TonB-linked outer membrane protein [Saprospiraceae bacterium]
MKKTTLVLLLLFCAMGTMLAQRTITGTVTDNAGEALIGASVIVKSSENVGTTTDIDGSYSLEVPAGLTVLIYSYTGYSTKEMTLGASNVMNVSLEEGILVGEVVVTALGIERESKDLGYSVDNVSSEELVRARETNIVNALQGKVTGVQVSNTGGNLGGSSKVIIRGVNSLAGRNNPLWVIDGVPFNDAQDSGGDPNGITGNRDFGNGASVVNPDDIASISVLKGAAATALYGSRAASGAILVTTKSGKGSKSGGPKIEINSSYRQDRLMVTPDYQQDYAMGSQFKYDSSSVGFDWGPRIVGQTVTLPVTGERGPLQAIDDNGINDFFETGNTFINNFAISDANEKMNYRLSLGALNQTGVVPASKLDRYTLSLKAGVKHSEKLRSDFGIQYINTSSEGTAAAGANDPNIIGYSSFSSTLDQNAFKPWIDEELGTQLNQPDPTANNPFWIRNENRNDRTDSRLLANFAMTYTPIKDLSFTGRVGYDYDQDNRFFSNRKGTAQRILGDFETNNLNRTQFNIDIIGNYKIDINDDFSLGILGGFNYNRREFSREGLRSDGLLVAELFDPGNAANNVPVRDFSEHVLFGAYSSVDLSYKNYLTLNLTGRNDWSSTLPIDNNSYFYPSASLAFVFSDALDLTSNVFSYGKLRTSFAQVGNDTNPYQLDFNFFPISSASGQYSLDVNFPFDGRLAFAKANTIPPENLLPERQNSFEVGAELKFFDYRLGLDISYFATQNNDQILRIPIPESTGFGFLRTNVGQVNTSGIEFTIDATPINRKNFQWNTAVNFSSAKTEVVELTEGVDRIQLASAFTSVSVQAVEGGGIELFATPFLRDTLTGSPTFGRPIINPTTGERQAGELQSFGSVLPDFNMGFVNNFSIGDFDLSFTVDWRSGGVMKSSTVENLQNGGLVQETVQNREGTFIDREGVLANTDGTFRDNDIPLASAQAFWSSLDNNGVSEASIFDASFVKLREIAVSYNLPKSLLENAKISGLSIGLEARNVALLWSKIPHIDPETNLFGSGVDGFGVERSNISSTRSMGVNLKLTF